MKRRWLKVPPLFRDMQETALAHYCLLAGETVQPRFGRRIGKATVRLTVNAGYE